MPPTNSNIKPIITSSIINAIAPSEPADSFKKYNMSPVNKPVISPINIFVDNPNFVFLSLKPPLIIYK